MLTIFKKEINQFLNSLLGYLVLVIFLVASGLLFWVFPESNVLDYGFAEMGGFFRLVPFVFIFLIPAITMRSFAEEKKSGTLEWLLTKPVGEWSIIMGKFLASWFLVLIALLPTLVYYFSLFQLGAPKGNIDSAGVLGSYLGLMLLASVFSAIGIFGSSITDNQLVAFVLAVFFCYFFYSGFASLAGINVWSEASPILEYLGLDFHYQALGKGLIDFRDVFYFVSVASAMLFATRLTLSSRRW
jgi:ABC-2 type transport system permease protein